MRIVNCARSSSYTMSAMAMLTSSTSRAVALKQSKAPAASASMRRAVAPVSSSGSRQVVDFAPSCLLQKRRYRNVVARAGAATAKHTPMVKIDNQTDAFATKITIDLGDQVGEMLDTIIALKNLGLNIRRAKLSQKGADNVVQNTFYITEASTSEKILKSARLEEIRMTVLNSLTTKFPEQAYGFNFGRVSSGYDSDGGSPTIRTVVPTMIDVLEASNGSCSILKIKTADRPGLLVDIVRVLKDVNLNVVSAEVDTLGAEAQDDFFVTYRGEPLSTPMVTLVTNALQYYLSLGEVAKEESY